MKIVFNAILDQILAHFGSLSGSLFGSFSGALRAPEIHENTSETNGFEAFGPPKGRGFGTLFDSILVPFRYIPGWP